MMFTSTVLLALSSSLISSVNAHGLVSSISIDGVSYDGYPAFNNANNPQRIVRAMYNNGPIEDVTSAPIACNGKNEPAALVANVTAGSIITYTWDTWPDSHKGPITNYMASCEGDCTTFDATKGKYFKIDETGYDAGTKLWATDKLISNNLKYSVLIPQGIASGQYLIRHEILALHSTNAPQYYPSCIQVQVTGGTGGSIPAEDLTTFPGAYSKDDPGYSFNIYYPPPTSYPIEGPPPIFASSSPTNGTNPSSSTAPVTAPTGTTSPAVSAPPSSSTSPASSTTSLAPTSSPSVRVCRPIAEGTVIKRKRAEGLARRMLSAKRHEGVPDVLRRLVGDY